MITLNASASVYCKIDGRIIHVLSSQGVKCNDELFYAGDACFAGKVEDAVKILNSKRIQKNFIGTDGESVGNAIKINDHQLNYHFIDEANDYVELNRMSRCSGTFWII